MANTTAEQDAGQAVSAASPLLGFVPFVGPILSALGSIGGGLLQNNAAQQQAKQAAAIRQQALNQAAQPMPSQYLAALHLAQMRNISGLPGIETDKTTLAQQLADQIRYIRMAAPGGNAALQAMGNAVAQNSKSLQNLSVQDQQYRAGAQDNLQKTWLDLGGEQDRLNTIRDTQRQQGLTAASAMENAAMQNKQQGLSTILGAVGKGATTIEDNAAKLSAQNQQPNYTANLNNWLMGTSPGTSPQSFDFLGGSTGNTTPDLPNTYLPPSLSGATGNLTP